MNLIRKVSAPFSGLSSFLNRVQKNNIFTQSNPLYFKLTDQLCGEPLKKKKKIDPGLIIQKEVKKQRKLEKEIRKLESKGRILKPIEEYEVNRNILNTLHKRKRKPEKLSDEEVGRRAWLMKRWASYKMHQYAVQDRRVERCIAEMNTALQELKMHSPHLYQLAITSDQKLIPFHCKGPPLTPPIPDHRPPDGEYIDTTRKFDK